MPAEREQSGEAALSENALSSALGRLRPEERAVLFLSVVEGYSAQQIGKLLEWPRGTVLSLIHRARGKLQRMMQGSEVPQ